MWWWLCSSHVQEEDGATPLATATPAIAEARDVDADDSQASSQPPQQAIPSTQQASPSAPEQVTTPVKKRYPPVQPVSPVSCASPGAAAQGYSSSSASGGAGVPALRRSRSSSDLAAYVGMTGNGGTGSGASIVTTPEEVGQGNRTRSPQWRVDKLQPSLVFNGNMLKRELQWAENCRQKWLTKDATEAILACNILFQTFQRQQQHHHHHQAPPPSSESPPPPPGHHRHRHN